MGALTRTANAMASLGREFDLEVAPVGVHDDARVEHVVGEVGHDDSLHRAAELAITVLRGRGSVAAARSRSGAE